MAEALETAAGRRGWIISDGKAGNDVQTRGVFDALGLKYEVKRVDPRGIWAVLSPWGPVDPAERFGTPQSQFHPPWPDFAISIGRLTTPYIRRLKRAAGLATYTIILQNPKVRGQDGRPLLGARARHAARAERDHDADGAAQLHGDGAWPSCAPACRRRSRRCRSRASPCCWAGRTAIFAMSRRRWGGSPRRCSRSAALGAGLMITPSRRTPAAIAEFVRDGDGRHAAHLLGRDGREPLSAVPGACRWLHRAGGLRQHDGRAVRDRQARLRVRAGRRLGEIHALPRDAAPAWRHAAAAGALRAAGDMELHSR